MLKEKPSILPVDLQHALDFYITCHLTDAFIEMDLQYVHSTLSTNSAQQEGGK